MTQLAIDYQIEAIRKVTQENLRSRKAAIKFLTDAGIIKPITKVNQPKKTNWK